MKRFFVYSVFLLLMCGNGDALVLQTNLTNNNSIILYCPENSRLPDVRKGELFETICTNPAKVLKKIYSANTLLEQEQEKIVKRVEEDVKPLLKEKGIDKELESHDFYILYDAYDKVKELKKPLVGKAKETLHSLEMLKDADVKNPIRFMNECVSDMCPNNRLINPSRRALLEQKVIGIVKKQNKNVINLVSFGAGALFDTLVIGSKIFKDCDCKRINFKLIDPIFAELIGACKKDPKACGCIDTGNFDAFEKCFDKSIEQKLYHRVMFFRLAQFVRWFSSIHGVSVSVMIYANAHDYIRSCMHTDKPKADVAIAGDMAGDEIDIHTIIDWACVELFALKHKGYSFWFSDFCLEIKQRTKKENSKENFDHISILKKGLDFDSIWRDQEKGKLIMDKIGKIFTAGGPFLTKKYETHFTFKDTLYSWLSWAKSLSCF